MRRSKLPYYARAVARLVLATDWPRALSQSARARRPCLALRDGPVLQPRSALDVLVAVETLCDDVYGLDRLSDPDLIVDVGAGIGDFAIAAALRFPASRILAFEPHPASFRVLRENMHRNGAVNVEAHAVAIGADGSSGSARRALGDWPFPAEGARLADYVGSAEVALLKIDCEGAELDVLTSLSPDGLTRVERVALEYHVTDGIERDRLVQDALREAGFDVVIRPDPYDPAIGYVDAVRRPPAPRTPPA